MNDLGRIEDLPLDYREQLGALNLVPLWPSLRGVMPAMCRRARPSPRIGLTSRSSRFCCAPVRSPQ